MLNTIVVTPENRGLFGPLLDEQFRQRHSLFVGQLSWEIPNAAGREMDQYDRVDTTYVLIEDRGHLVAYARLLPTTSSVAYGPTRFTYLVKDAVDGKLPGIPQDILHKGQPPISADVWEMTRVEARDRFALEALFSSANRFLWDVGARRAITFTRKNFARILSGLGYRTQPTGPDVFYGGKRYCSMSTELTNSIASQADKVVSCNTAISRAGTKLALSESPAHVD